MSSHHCDVVIRSDTCRLHILKSTPHSITQWSANTPLVLECHIRGGGGGGGGWLVEFNHSLSNSSGSHHKMCSKECISFGPKQSYKMSE